MDGSMCAGLFTRRFGPPPREGLPTTVLVHGLGLSGRYFVPLARRLAAGGTTVLVPDLPGNARSRGVVRRTPDMGEVAAALARWHRRLSLGPTVAVGNSVGCQVVASFAAQHPDAVRRTVLLAPALEPRTAALRHFGRLLADAPREPLALLALAATDYLLTGPVRCALSFRHALRDADAAFEQHLARIDAPTLVVRGTGDTIVTAAWSRRVAGLVPRGQAVDVPGTAHAAHYSAPDTIARLIRDFSAKEDT
ncbi:alpha/beta fold hydrolase [Streptomyces sp. NPDC006733]|uniref:alpha/beta fold hydrolase n=1 Tax=Streptomyces sp. NPDC006733 TaxID=3155460 RepID=UPI0034021B0B